jgi:hypothetical protein
MFWLPPPLDQPQLLSVEELEALVGCKVDHQPGLTALLGTTGATWMGFEARTPVPGHNAL